MERIKNIIKTLSSTENTHLGIKEEKILDLLKSLRFGKKELKKFSDLELKEVGIFLKRWINTYEVMHFDIPLEERIYSLLQNSEELDVKELGKRIMKETDLLIKMKKEEDGDFENFDTFHDRERERK